MHLCMSLCTASTPCPTHQQSQGIYLFLFAVAAGPVGVIHSLYQLEAPGPQLDFSLYVSGSMCDSCSSVNHQGVVGTSQAEPVPE